VIKISQEERPDGAPLLEEKERRHLLEIYSTGRLPLDFSLSTAMTHPPFHPPSKIHPIDEDLNRTRSDQIDFGESILRASQRKDGIELKDRLLCILSRKQGIPPIPLREKAFPVSIPDLLISIR